MPYENVDVEAVADELERLLRCIDAAIALTERRLLPGLKPEKAREACELILVDAKFDILMPVQEYLDSCFKSDPE